MKTPSPYLKMRVLGAIENATGETIKKRIQKTALLVFIDEEGNKRRFTWRTISTWYYRYKNHGITGITTKSRSDKGKTRKIMPEELLEAINQALPFFKDGKKPNRTEIYRMCIEKDILKREQLAPTTYYRYVREYDLLNDNFDHNKKRLAFAMEHANDLWQADTMFGPYVKNPEGKMIQTKLIAFIDDASRVICHAQFFFNENIDALITAIKAAFYKRGIPKQLYVDNGSIYCSREITLICARVGCILRHTPVRDGASKGKIERFFRRLRDQFLSRKLDLSSLNVLNKQLTVWIEERYNTSDHSAIGMPPINRFSLDMNFIKFLPPNQTNDELFYAEETRTVKKDNTFSHKNVRYEPPADLRDKPITIRFDRNRLNRIIVYYKTHRIGKAEKLNLIANGKLRRGGKK
ncbi:MAG: DDE-type integrase/transposase/recombinase [Desulfobacterales bacterium]|nr:DDE-type integrase/transposase/recombinase [Desulfobacterales bacterium]